MSQNPSTTRSEWALQELENMIYRDELKPGDHIKETALAARFNMSRGAVREVCRSLESTGLVVTIPHRGVFVRTYTMREILEMFDVRAHLADMAVRQAAMNITPRKLLVLEELLHEMQKTMGKEDQGHVYMHLNWKFHDEITRLSDNSLLIDLIDTFRKRQFVSCRQSFQAKESTFESHAEHQDILAALKSGKPAKAADLMKKHVIGGKKRFLRIMSLYESD